KSSTQEGDQKRKKAVLFLFKEAKQILWGDIGDTLLPLNDWRYALYDATYETKESKKRRDPILPLFSFINGIQPLKIAIKKKFTEFFLFSIKHEWQVNGLDDIKDRSTLGEKLGGNVVVSLEGKPL
uniref:Uncharacterized protein n=1 Tax=Cercocebus atys TaxID=9531 RepID=A0A2K5MNB0_CERAT